jgi:hypothetical protein
MNSSNCDACVWGNLHSKLPTLVVQPDATTEQYVIRVPDALTDGQAWAHVVSGVKAITAKTQGNGSRRNG